MSGKTSLLEHVKEVCASRYDVRGEIGRGGMAAVFVAQDLRLNRRVALKVMLPGLAFTDGMSERFEQEARTAANLDHPNIVTIFGVEELDDLFCFVMKYVEGRSLDMVTRDVGPLPIDVTHFLLLRVTMALGYAHDEGVVHRDVKPGNVLLDRRGTPIVTDFGIAKAAESPSLTVTGSIIGTPPYMSPEQFMGRPALPASDQYALGIMAYEMLAGELPFQGSMLELQLAHLQKIPTPIDEVRRDTPPPLAAIVTRMLAKEPTERFATLHEAEAALREIPLDEEAARGKLVELGFLASMTAPFGLASTPLRSAPAMRASAASRSMPTDDGEAVASSTPEAPTTPVTPVTPVASVAYVRIDPIPSTFTAGEIIPLRGSAYDASNTPIPGKELAWEIWPTDAGQISANGTLTVRTPGDITVTASCDGKHSLARAEVTPLPVNRRAGFVATEIGCAPATNPVDAQRSAASLTASPHASDGISDAPALQRPDVRRLLSVSAAVSAIVLAGLMVIVALKLRDPPTTGMPSTSTKRSAAVTAPPAAPSRTRTRVPSTLTDSIVAATEATPATEARPAREAPLGAGARVAVVSLQIVDPPATITVGDRLQLQAFARGPAGERLANEPVSWRSSNARIASVVASRGTVRALRPGAVELTASARGIEQQLSLQISAPTLTSIAIVNLRALTVGETFTVALSARAEGGALDDTALNAIGITGRWSSSSPEVARIDARTGQLRALSPGTTTIRVEAGTLAATGSVVVSGASAVASSGASAPRAESPATQPAPVAARGASDVSREIEGALKEYATAVSARDLNAMLRVFPTMADKDKATWRQFFRDGTDVAYRLVDVELHRPVDVGESAKLTLTRRWSLGFTLARTQQVMGPTSGSDRVTMVRSGGSWHITQIQ
ncbi:MAG: serine/threonine-protein kinase [Gemmatimonadota bacterium]